MALRLIFTKNKHRDRENERERDADWKPMWNEIKAELMHHITKIRWIQLSFAVTCVSNQYVHQDMCVHQHPPETHTYTHTHKRC